MGGVTMDNKYFKALIPFSSGKGIYNPADKEPGKANADMVDSWVKVGYCIEVEAPTIDVDVVNPLDEQEAIVESIVEVLPVEDTNTPSEVETPENEATEKPNDDYDNMGYVDLKKAAKEAGIKGYNTMKQKDLVVALRGDK
jgi:hypothetical protein